MIDTEIGPKFASGVRDELSALGTKGSRLEKHQRRFRALGIGTAVLVLAGATTGAALVINSLPGSETVASIGNRISASGTGTANIDLGVVPARASAVIIDLKCVTKRGTVSYLLDSSSSSHADEGSADCSIANGIHITDGRLPAAGQTSITITADPGTSWKATAQYATRTTSDWAVNARGQTYGVINGHGMPDLQAAQATNGKQGYILTKEILNFEGNGTINVYEFDGVSIIGKFPIGDQ